MFDKFSRIGSIAGKAATVAGKVTSFAATATYEAIIGRVEKHTSAVDLEVILNKLDTNFTAIPVVVTCQSNGLGPNDYQLVFDLSAFEKALNEGRFKRPKIIVRAQQAELLDRDLLAERMETGLRPLLKNYEKYVSAEKSKILDARSEEDFWNWIGFLLLTVAGAVLGPVLWIIIGLDSWRALKSLPGLLFSAIKSGVYKLIFGDELTQLDNELESARTAIKLMVKNMEIEPLI